jgi:hypothetical protein
MIEGTDGAQLDALILLHNLFSLAHQVLSISLDGLLRSLIDD